MVNLIGPFRDHGLRSFRIFRQEADLGGGNDSPLKSRGRSQKFVLPRLLVMVEKSIR